MGLNESYPTVRSQILTMDPLPSANKAYSLILQELKQRGIHTMHTQSQEGAGMETIHGNKKASRRSVGQASYQAGRGWGHATRSYVRERPQCDHCGNFGHTIDQCQILKGTSNSNKLQKKTSASTSGLPLR